MARWTRFAAKGGIGKCTAVRDCVAQSSNDLMFLRVRSLRLVTGNPQISHCMQDDEIIVLMQLQEQPDTYLVSVHVRSLVLPLTLQRTRRAIVRASSASSKVPSSGFMVHLSGQSSPSELLAIRPLAHPAPVLHRTAHARHRHPHLSLNPGRDRHRLFL